MWRTNIKPVRPIHADVTLRQPFTISIEFVQRMLEPARQEGIAIADILHRSGVDPDFLRRPDARITGEQYLAVFQGLFAALQDEAMGFFSRPFRSGTFAMIASYAQSAKNIEQSMKRACRGVNLLQDEIVVECVDAPDLAGLKIHLPTGFPAQRLFVCEIILSVMHRLLDWLKMGDLRALRCDLRYAQPLHPDEYHRLFGCEVRFDQPDSILWFDRENLDATVRRNSSELVDFLADPTRNIVLPHARLGSYNARVRELLRKSRPRWMNLNESAVALNLSSSALQRHLQAESQSFQAVKNELRRDLAIAMLATSSQSLEAIAVELGFSDSATFQRAFKLWTGTPAGLYRKDLES